MGLPLMCGSTGEGRSDQLGACEGRHFSKRISSGTNEQFFSPLSRKPSSLVI